MKLALAVLSFFILTSCNKVQDKKVGSALDNTITQSISKETLSASVLEDTLRTPSHYYYLADLNLQEIGKLILEDSIQPADNHVTFALMDSISSTNKKTRDTLFPAFKAVVEESDGALSEAVGLYAMKYVEAYPKEFAERYSCCFKEMVSLTKYIGYEIMMAEDPKAEYKKLFEKIKQNYPEAGRNMTITDFQKELGTYMKTWED